MRNWLSKPIDRNMAKKKKMTYGATHILREGHRVIRFWNNDVTTNLDGVPAAIRSALIPCVPSPSQAFGLKATLSREGRR